MVSVGVGDSEMERRRASELYCIACYRASFLFSWQSIVLVVTVVVVVGAATFVMKDPAVSVIWLKFAIQLALFWPTLVCRTNGYPAAGKEEIQTRL